MKLVEITQAEINAVKNVNNKVGKFINDFSESGKEIMRVEQWESDYKNVYSLCACINNTTKRLSMPHITCIIRESVPYMVNKVLYDK